MRAAYGVYYNGAQSLQPFKAGVAAAFSLDCTACIAAPFVKVCHALGFGAVCCLSVLVNAHAVRLPVFGCLFERLIISVLI